MDCHVYKLDFDSGKSYIGLTTNVDRRLRQHAGNKTLVGNAFRKHGRPSISILFNGDIESAKLEEIECIKRFNTRAPQGYNLTDGGDGVLNLDEKARKAISEKNKIHFQRNASILLKAVAAATAARKGKPSPLRGRKLSPEHRAKMSKAGMGKVPWNKGRAWTENEREMLSKAHRGHKHSEETKQKMRGPRGPHLKQED